MFEAPIDLLSAATLYHQRSPDEWDSVHYLSLGGVSLKALEQYLADHQEVRKITLCLDNDKPGREAAAKIRAALETKGYKVIDALPPSGKDWNQHLCNVIQQDKALNRRQKEAAILV